MNGRTIREVEPSYEIGEEEPIRRHGFLWTVVPEGVILSKNLEAYDVRVYAFLNMRAGDKEVTWYGVQTVCEELGMSEATVKRSFKRLVDDNWIRRERRLGTSSITHVFERQIDCIAFDTSLDQGRPSISSEEIRHDISSDTINRDSIKQRQLNIGATNFSESDAAVVDPILAIQEVAVKFDHSVGGEKSTSQESISRGARQDFDIKAEYEKEFHVSPDWNLRHMRRFLQWLKEKSPEQKIKTFAWWWYNNDWRGKQGQPPTISQVMELWPQAFIVPARDPRNNPAVVTE